MVDELQTVKCVIFTLRRENVIVPHALVAEIISVKKVAKLKNTPKWLLGNMNWRDSKVPLISFEAAASDAADSVVVNLNTQAVVLFAVGNDGAVRKTPYLGLIMSGVPHVTEFRRDQMLVDEEVEVTHPMVANRVRINGASASVLDVDAMVSMLGQYIS